MDCYEIMKRFCLVDSDGDCDGIYDTTTGNPMFKCCQCPYYKDNREVNLLGEVKKI